VISSLASDQGTGAGMGRGGLRSVGAGRRLSRELYRSVLTGSGSGAFSKVALGIGEKGYRLL
jgi:hypothetical protein